MPDDRLRDRIVDQFSYRGDRADIWRAFDRFLETDAFLNLGYSKRYQPHWLGSSQRRLAAKVTAEVGPRLPARGTVRLLDVGCGRGGPTIELAGSLDATVVGIDLVPFNVTKATENARESGTAVEFLMGDATRLPIATGSVTACAAIDAIVYVPNSVAVFEELARVLDTDGLLAVSDLLVRDDPSREATDAVAAFAEGWDMPPLRTVDGYLTTLEHAGFAIDDLQDITANSVGRFRTWTSLYLALDARAPDLLERFLARWDLDRETVSDQVRRAHRALPHLRHVVVYATREARP